MRYPKVILLRMSRRYDSRRRKQAAERTRQDIVRAALELHWRGVTSFDAMAAEAGCSTATVRKHFPTKEHLFRDCTRTFGESLRMPDVAAIAAIEDADSRVEHAVHELCRIHEAFFGYAWHSAHMRADSPTLDAVMSDYEALSDAIGEIVADAGEGDFGVVRGLLDFLSYRAFRTSGGLSPERSARAIHDLVCAARARGASERPEGATP